MTIRQTMALEDRMSAQFHSIERAMGGAALAAEKQRIKMEEMQASYGTTANRIEELEREIEAATAAQAALDNAMRGGNMAEYMDAAANTARRSVTELDKMIEQQIKLVGQNDALSNAMSIQTQTYEQAAGKVRELEDSYFKLAEGERLAAEQMAADANAGIAEQERFRQRFMETNAEAERMSPIIDRNAHAVQSAAAQMEIAAERAEMYRQKLERIAREAALNEEALARLNLAQEQVFSPIRQQEIAGLTDQQRKLTEQYNRMEASLHSAEMTHANAFNRMHQSSMRMNPVINGLSQGLGSMPGALGQIGRVGVQAFAGITAGAKAAQVASLAMNAALSVGISLLIQAGVSAWNEYNQAQEDAQREAEELEIAARDAAEELEREIKAAETLISAYSVGMGKLARSMSKETREETVAYYERRAALESSVSQMQIYGYELERNWMELEELAKKEALAGDELERMNSLAARMVGIFPGMIQYLYDETGAIDIQTTAVYGLVDSYIALAEAKAKASVAEELFGESFKQKMLSEKRLEDMMLNAPTRDELRMQTICCGSRPEAS